MVEIIRNMALDFVLFSLIEGYLYALFFNKVCGCFKFKLWQIFVMSIGNCLIASFLPPLIYQWCMICWMGMFISYVEQRKDIKFFLYPTTLVLIMLVVEMCFAFFYEKTLGIYFASTNTFMMFLYIVPIRVVELLIILGGEKLMKTWIGSIVRK